MSNRLIDAMCKSKKKGHRCIVPKDNKHATHHCLCKETWDEVKT